MTTVPAALGGEIILWRLDLERHAPTWNMGEGAYRVGGRWNSRGTRAVYSSLDASTAILEVAVHKGFTTLDTVAHILTAARILDPAQIHIVEPNGLPNPNWLRPGIPSAGQQAFGNDLIGRHKLVALPSAVCPFSWNVVFDPERAAGTYEVLFQERFALDTRLHPPA